MSTKHLSVGSVDPPRTKGLLRLYSMKFCPFAHRAALVLRAKNIPHEVVYISLFKKPEWYSNINKKGTVPTLIDGDKTLSESLDIAYYLDEKYPANPLCPPDPRDKQKVKDIIEKAGPAQMMFGKLVFLPEEKSIEEWTKLFLQALQPLEDELANMKTPFFGGNKPGMADYMIWPWAERSDCIGMKLGQNLAFKNSDIPLLRKWRKDMMTDPTCKELYISGERFWKISKCKLVGEEPLYDEV